MEAFLPIIILAVVFGVISKISKALQDARNAADRPQPQGSRRVAAMDDQLRQQIRQRMNGWQPSTTESESRPAQPAAVEGASDYEDARWPIEPKVAPSEIPAKPSVAPMAPRVAVNIEGGGLGDRAVTRKVMTPRYNAEDSHGRTRAPHLQDDERSMDSFTGAATFRRTAPRSRGERVDIRPLLQSPMAMANAVILTEVLHHRGGRSAKWSR